MREAVVIRITTISKLKAACLRLVRIVPTREDPTLSGSVASLASDEELRAAIDVDWAAERS